MVEKGKLKEGNINAVGAYAIPPPTSSRYGEEKGTDVKMHHSRNLCNLLYFKVL